MRVFAKNLISRSSLMDFFSIFWFPLLVFLIHLFLIRVLNAYKLLPSIDIPMHFLGGLSMAYSIFLALAYLQDHEKINQIDKLVEWLLVFSLVTTIAVCWEFVEFSLDQLWGTNIQISLQNTMRDLLMGILGAFTMIGFSIARKR